MAEDRVTITADASQYFDVMRQASERASKFDDALRRTGASMDGIKLKTERGLTQSIRGFATDLGSARSASDVLTLGLFRLGDAFRGSLALSAGATAGVVLFQRISQDSQAADLSVKKLSADLASMGRVSGPEKIVAQIQRVSAEIEDAATKAQTFGNRVWNFLDASVNPLIGTSSRGTGAAQQSAIASGARQLAELAQRRVFYENALLAIKRESVDADDQQSAIDKSILDTAEKKAAIDEESKRKRLDLFDLTSRGLLSPRSRDSLIRADLNAAAELKRIVDETGQIEIARLQKAIELRRGEANLTRFQNETNFFRDVGSGKFAKDFQANQLERAQEQRGRELVDELRDASERGVGLDPTLQAILGAADQRASTEDFSGIASLSGLEFEGLRALDGLQISIK